MRLRSFATMGLLLALVGCEGCQAFKDAPLDRKVLVSRQVYNATVSTPITHYAMLKDCDVLPRANPCSEDAVVVALNQANLSAIAAQDAVEKVVRLNDPKVDVATFIVAANAAMEAAKQIMLQYGVGTKP